MGRESEAMDPESASDKSWATLLSAIPDLALLCLCLVGLIDRGGTRTYLSGSLLFSSTFVSIVLVLAFYVWFKSRAAPRRGYHRSSPSGRITIEARSTFVSIVLVLAFYVWFKSRAAPRRGYHRPSTSGLITIEARYKPPGASGNFYLGVCADDEEAGTKQEIAACYYDRHSRWLAIKDREECFEIPLTPSVPTNLDAVGKRRWVKTRVREVHEEYKRFAASLPNPPVQHPSVAFDPDIRLEDMDQDLFYNPEAMFDSLAVETQHVPEAVPIMFPGAGGHHSEVAVGGGAAQVILQSNSCEVPPTLSASRASPGTDVVFFQQLSAPLAGPSNVDHPQNTILDLMQAWEAVSLYKQINEEKDRLLAEQNRIIDWLKLENERLRSISTY